MTEGYGNTRKQAERNASINGLRWLKNNKLLAENAASCSGVGVHHNPLDNVVPVAFNAQQNEEEGEVDVQMQKINNKSAAMNIENEDEEEESDEGEGEEEEKSDF